MVNSNASIEMQLLSRRKAAKMLVVVVIVFAVCYFPVHVIAILRYCTTTINIIYSITNTCYSSPNYKTHSKRLILPSFLPCFNVCLYTCTCRSVVTPERLPQNDYTVAAAMISHWLCYFNSAINPVIYNFMSGECP